MTALRAIKNYLLSHFPVVAIIVIWGVLLFTNHTPGTYLAGWDSLQTELDPGLAVKRAFYSSWQEYQSLGLPAGMGHAADLLRSVALYLASFIVPQNLIRYGFQMVMVLVGALGVLKLLDLSGLKKSKESFAFLGALSYMLNFNIIQMMFLPYESFTIFLGMLPWEIWVFLRLLNKDLPAGRQGILKRKDWLIFFLVFVLATPQSQALQLFVVLMLTLGLLTLGVFINVIARKNDEAISHPNRLPRSLSVVRNDKIKLSLSIFKRSALAAMVIILINSFWLLPQFYFLKTSSSVVQTAKINQLSTQDVFYRNKDKGNPKDFFSYTGFFSDGVDRNQQPLFTDWKNHRDSLPIMILIYVMTGVSLIGIIPRSKYRVPFLFLYILVAVSLLNNIFPLDALNTLIRKNSLINQIFRSPFTKFSILYALVASYFFAHGALFLATTFAKYIPEKRHRIVKSSFVILVSGLILIQSLPAFQGNYISREVRVKIPENYFDMFRYFKTVDKNKRIALLPEYTHWGWFFNDWGYDGSGFIWYGIEQPIISRNFDMWSTKGEGYYWEIKDALEKEDMGAVEKILEKYNVDYLVFDHSVAPVVASSKAIQNNRVEDMLSQSAKIKLEKKWGFLSIYKVAHDKKIQDFVWAADSLPNIGPEIDLTNVDNAYNQYGDYQTKPDENYEMYYPFLDLTTQTKTAKANWDMKESGNEWVFSAKLPGNIDIPEKTGTSQISLYHNDDAVNFTVPYTINAENGFIYVRFPKILANSFKLENTLLRYCVNKKGDIPSSQTNKSIKINASEGDYICADYEDINLDQKYGYIVKIENKNIDGQRLFFYALDKTKEQPYIEDRLSQDTQYYILGNKFSQGTGYTFAFQANSYKTIPSANELNALSVYLMPYDVVKGLGINLSSGSIKKAQTSNSFEAKKLAYHKYTVDMDKGSNNSTVVLNQAYHEGWKAYEIVYGKSQIANSLKDAFPSIFGTEVKNHVIVNNWANGWTLEDQKSNLKDQKIFIVYLPQYLEYMGFSLVAITGFLLLINFKIKVGRKRDTLA